MIGRILNERYRIIEKIGSGGMADVYRGEDIQNNRIVAIKVLKQEHSDDPQYLRRLQREAQAMVSIENEHVVSLYDMGSEDDVHYLVLEYVNGRTLRDYMDKNGVMKPHVAVRMICDVLKGLSDAHKLDLIHRDVKPQNIMITDDGSVKLTDFGIAKFAGNSTKTFDGKEAMGSVYYISPEQAKGEEVDATTDIYSAGILLYEMLSGDPPFSGDNAVQVALKHVNEDIKPLHEVNPWISLALSDVVARATAKDRSIRYSNADDMIRDLNRALRYPFSRFAKIHPKETKHLQHDTVPVMQGSRFVKEHLPLIIIVACVLGVIAIFVAMFFISTGWNGSSEYVKIPSFLGYTEDSAVAYAENRGFIIEVVGYESSDDYSPGEICSQDPAAQSKAKEGTVVSVIISTGMETVKVPSLIGLTVEEAKKALEDVGLVLDTEIDYRSGDEPAGTVVAQSINPDETVMVGDAVSITVSKEPVSDTVKMPDLIGEDIESALDLLSEVGIEKYRIIVRNPSDQEPQYADRTVVDQTPSSGMDIINNMVTVEITMYMSEIGEYKAEFSENVTLSAESNDVIFTVVTDLGEIVLYRAEFGSGTYSIPFTGRYWEAGSFTCIIYVNGEVYTSFIRNFE